MSWFIYKGRRGRWIDGGREIALDRTQDALVQARREQPERREFDVVAPYMDDLIEWEPEEKPETVEDEEVDDFDFDDVDDDDVDDDDDDEARRAARRAARGDTYPRRIPGEGDPEGSPYELVVGDRSLFDVNFNSNLTAVEFKPQLEELLDFSLSGQPIMFRRK